MKRLYIVLYMFLALNWCIAQSQAEIYLEKDRLTVNVQDASIEEVFQELAQQGDIRVVAFEEMNVGHVKISKRFWNLPLEEGLDRLLAGWNYGLHRNQSTGKIVTLYLVSRQTTSPSPVERSFTLGSQPLDDRIVESSNQPTNFRSTHPLDFPDYDDVDEDDDEEDRDDEYEEFSDDSGLRRMSLAILPPALRAQFEK